MHVEMDDGQAADYGPGDVMNIPPGHDAWIVGDETCVVLDFGGLQGVNPGSLGQPKDGDPRAAYAVLEQGGLTLKRVEYDIEHTVRGLELSGCSRAAVSALSSLLWTGRVPAA
jgi:diadenosine tetraphosphatase ApaH/serine/threonine PP2A family protein phosphatase